MILRFPSFDVLQLALTSEVVDQQVQSAPARYVHLEDGSVVIEPSQSVSRAALAGLKKLGVESKRSYKADFLPVASWHEALPLIPVGEDDVGGDKAEVLFEINGEQALPLIVGEMLRLGNDRQSFRYVGENGTAKTLLRVTAPPYYTMLRATDRFGEQVDGEKAGVSMVAYVQQASRVWVQVGYRHPLGERLVPPAGKWLLIARNHRWRFLKEGAFRDVYELLEFALPDAPQQLSDREPTERIRIPLELGVGSAQEAAELWVVSKDAMTQVEKLVARSDDRLISRLAFAVAEGGGEDGQGATVIIRARPSKQLPPVLVLDAQAFRPYLKIPNLFLPVGQRLHPPLRRDAVIKLLASQKDQITWLAPGNDAAFTPQSIPDVAFRPLSDWIDYVIDHEAKPLEAWVASHRFDFEHFVCHDDKERKKPGPPKKATEKESGKSGGGSSAERGATSKTPRKGTKSEKKDSSSALEFIDTPSRKPKQDALQVRLRALENDFQQSSEPLDSPARAAIWRDMALTNSALRHRHDATICWVNSMWPDASIRDSILGSESIDSDGDAVTAWLRCEQHCSSVGTLTLEVLDELMANRTSHASDPSLVASYLVWAATRPEMPPAIAQRQTELTQFLQRQETYLPVRAAWMAWCAMYKMSGSDVLLLARARDRLLERLFNQGLAPEFDMAAFMRTGGIGEGDRFRVLRDQVMKLHAMANAWIIEPPISSDPQTKAYADLVFAYALARLGESAYCGEKLEEIEAKLNRGDEIHSWVFQAYQMRIKQALEGKSSHGQLSEDLSQKLESLERMDRYKLDRLRERSRILEPHVQIDPFQNYHERYPDALSRDLAQLQKIVDRDDLADAIATLSNNHPGAADQIRILPSVLQLSPRLGERFAGDLLGEVPPLIGKCKQPMDKARLLQRALHISAHFGRVDLVQGFVAAMNEALPDIVADYLDIDAQMTPENKERAEATESLLSQSFRGLRKLGMRDEIGRVYGTVADLVERNAGKTKAAKKRQGIAGIATRSQRLLLCVAGGWYYFGQEESARKIVNKVRVVLKSGELPGNEQKSLTCAYLDSVSQAPVEEAVERVQQIFAVTKKGKPEWPEIKDSMATCSHFSISQLDVVEAAVSSLISDDFSLSADARRWLDEDEFLVRSRIHQDVRQATGS